MVISPFNPIIDEEYKQKADIFCKTFPNLNFSKFKMRQFHGNIELRLRIDFGFDCGLCQNRLVALDVLCNIYRKFQSPIYNLPSLHKNVCHINQKYLNNNKIEVVLRFGIWPLSTDEINFFSLNPEKTVNNFRTNGLYSVLEGLGAWQN